MDWRATIGVRRATSSTLAVLLGAGILVTATAGATLAVSAARINPVWSDGTIHQCLDNKTFLTKTLPRGKSCPKGTTGFAFHQQGERGPKGDTGAPGLGASVLSDDSAFPAPFSDGILSVVKQVTITMPRAGNLLILDATVESATLDNTSDTTVHYTAGVYVDGVGVPGGNSLSPGSVPPQGNYNTGKISMGPISMTGLSAGTHTIAIKLRTTDANSDYLTQGSGRIVAIATG